MKKILFFLLLSLPLSAQELVLNKGVVMDDLKVADTLEQTYALYLPTTYENKKLWPVLFVFDGEGRGKAAAQLLQSTAEEQGYIIVSSNDINRQETLEKNVLTAAVLMQHTAGILPIDSRQIASVGSMAGARAASTIPLVFNEILGVVAVGDHWMNFNLLDNKDNFSFIGIAGDEQFSTTGMQNTAATLSSLRFPTQIYTYSGDEDWPKPEILNSAIGSLTLEAMRKKFRPVNLQLVEKLYQQDLQRVNKLMSLNQLLNANALLEIMEEKYRGIRNLAEVDSKLSQLSRSRNFLQQNREEDVIQDKQSRLIEDFIYYLEEDIRTGNFENLGWWNFQKKKLDSLAQKNNGEARMAHRLEDFISEFIDIQRRELKETRAPLESKLIANMIQTIFDPHAFEAYREIISLSAQDNDFSTAFFYLEEMLKHGYKDIENLYNIEGTLGLRLTPEYNQIIENHLGDAKFYDVQTDSQK